MAESAALLADDILLHSRIRLWVLSTHLISYAGFIRGTAQTGVITLGGPLCFHRVKAANVDELKVLAHAIRYRVARFLKKRGFLGRGCQEQLFCAGTR